MEYKTIKLFGIYSLHVNGNSVDEPLQDNVLCPFVLSTVAANSESIRSQKN